MSAPELEHDLRCQSWQSDDPAVCTCRDGAGHTATPWHEGPWVSYDTETTGVEVSTDRIVTATVVAYTPGAGVVITEWLADPGIEIDPGATAVHGISTEHARGHGRPAAEVVAEVADLLASLWTATVPLIAYNGAFDLDITDTELRRHHRRRLVVSGPMIDPLILDKQHDRYRRGSRKLVDVCAHYRVRIGNAHDATEDALAAARVAWKIARASAAIRAMTLPELHAAQVRWFAEQQRSFADYLRKKVAPTVEDADERDALLERADTIDAHAEGWPLRGVA